jgi:spore maturation protein CgeB
MLLRKERIGACIPLGLHTFGDPEGWNDLFGAERGPTAHPDADYRSELAAIYRSIAINLNITSCQMPTAVNQRVFDIPLCGGFVLSDRQSDCDELFAPGEAALYSSKEELIDKIAFFRVNEDERRRISARARARILSCHTYSHRLETIESLISR